MALHAQTAATWTAAESVGGSYTLLRALVDRQVQTLEDVFPGLMDAIDMRPVEHWCVWGALMELRGDDLERVQAEFEVYVRRREQLSDAQAGELACRVQRATATPHTLADGVALAGREAVRTGFDRCFFAAAMYLRGRSAPTSDESLSVQHHKTGRAGA